MHGVTMKFSYLCLLPRLLFTYILPSIFPSIMCFRRQFLHKEWKIQIIFLLVIDGRMFFSFFTLHNTSPFSLGPSKWSSPSFSRNEFRNHPDIPDVLFGVFVFQHHTKLCFKCNFSLVSSLHLNPVCYWKELPLVECRVCLGNPVFEFTFTSSIIHHANLIIEIFQTVQSFLIYLYGGWLPGDFHQISFFSTSF